MNNQKGFSLAIAMGITLLLLVLSMMTLKSLASNANMRSGIYAQNVAFNAAESGVHHAAPTILDDAKNKFTTILEPGFLYTPDQALAYTLGTFSGDFSVTFRDNNDLDGDPNTDVDKRVIIEAVGRLKTNSGNEGTSTIQILTAYRGAADEYAQATGGSKSSSSYSGEINISDLTSQTSTN